MTTNNMTELTQRKTFEEVIDYIQNEKTKIKHPDRTAKFLRNSFELSQLDYAGMLLMEQQQFREMKQREKEHLLRQLVANAGKSMVEARAADDSIEHQFDSPFDFSIHLSLKAQMSQQRNNHPQGAQLVQEYLKLLLI